MPLQRRNGEFIFRSSNAIKPATDLPEDMMKRVRAATQDFCTMESRPGRSASVSAPMAQPQARQAVRDSRCQHKHGSGSMCDMYIAHVVCMYIGTAPQVPGTTVQGSSSCHVIHVLSCHGAEMVNSERCLCMMCGTDGLRTT